MFAAAYEKLVMYGVYVHCGIDGGSNFIVYAVVDVNKRAETLWRGYSEAVANFGRPAMLRADMAFEAQPIGQDMLNHRGPGTYISGPSTSNQVTDTLPFSFTLFALHSCTTLTAHLTAHCNAENRELLELHLVALGLVLEESFHGNGGRRHPG